MASRFGKVGARLLAGTLLAGIAAMWSGTASAACTTSGGVTTCDPTPPNPDPNGAQGTDIRILTGAIVQRQNGGPSVQLANSGRLDAQAGSTILNGLPGSSAISAGNDTAVDLAGTVRTSFKQAIFIGNRATLTLPEGGLVEATGTGPELLPPIGVIVGGENSAFEIDGTVRTTGAFNAGIFNGFNPAGLSLRFFPTTIEIGETGLVETLGNNSDAILFGAASTLTVAGTVRTSGANSAAIVFNNSPVINILEGAMVESAQRPAIVGRFESAARLTIAGRVAGPSASAVAISLSNQSDEVTLAQTADVVGIIAGGDGVDTLRLTGDSVANPARTTIGRIEQFEQLAVQGGYWIGTNHDGTSAGTFTAATISPGASLELRNDFAQGPLLAGSYANNGSLVLNFTSSADDRQFRAPVTGTGQLLLTGPATVRLGTAGSGGLTYTGPTIVQNGALILSGSLSGDLVVGAGTSATISGGPQGQSIGNLINNGAFVYDQATGGTITGGVSGTGSFTTNGTGTLAVAGQYANTGPTTINAGTLRLLGGTDPSLAFTVDAGTLEFGAASQTIAGLSGGTGGTVLLSSGPLTLNQAGDTVFAGAITGTGGLTKAGSGRLTLSGTSSYSGATQVNAGTLRVEGTLASAVTVAGARIEGGGGIGGLSAGTAGVVAPGAGIGTLNVSGPVSFGQGSTFEVQANAAGAADRITATGAASLTGGTVQVLAENGTYAPATQYVILTAGGGVQGQFAGVTSNLAFLTPSLVYGANQVALALTRNDILLPDVATTPNQQATAEAVEQLGPTSPIFIAIVGQSADTARASFESLSGEAYASFAAYRAEDSRAVRNAVLSEARRTGDGVTIWADALGDWGEADAGDGVASVESKQEGALFGVKVARGGFNGGLVAGFGDGRYEVDDRTSRARTDDTFLGGHLGYNQGPLSVQFGAVYTWHEAEVDRGIGLAGVADVAGEFEGSTTQLFGELGYSLGEGPVRVTPFASWAYVATRSDEFTETGGAAALNVDTRDLDTHFVSLGARAEGEVAAGEGATLQPFLSAAYRHTLGDRRASSTMRFGTDPTFEIVGARLSRGAAEIEAGLNLEAGRLHAGVSYSGLVSGRWQDHGGRLTIGYRF